MVNIQGVVFATGARQYMWYVERLVKTCNEVDWIFATPSKNYKRTIDNHAESIGKRLPGETGSRVTEPVINHSGL